MKTLLSLLLVCLVACDITHTVRSAPESFSRELLENKYPTGSKVQIYSSADALIGGAYLDPRKIFEVEILDYSYDFIKIKYLDVVPNSWNEGADGNIAWRERRLFFPIDLLRE